MKPLNRRDILKLGLVSAVTATSTAFSRLPELESAALPLDSISTGRNKLNFNRDWRFQLGNHEGAESESYDDTEWELTHLPHSFSQPYWGESTFYVGEGWYRKPFVIPANWRSKIVRLEFEAAFQNALIYINGKAAGGHQGGYTGFSIDITPHIVTGNNHVVVRLDNNWNAQIAPRAGEHQFAGGIYRNVYLVVTDQVSIPYNGIAVTTPSLSAQSAIVSVSTLVHNYGKTPADITVTHEILSPSGASLTKFEKMQLVPAKGSIIFSQVGPPINNPLLWHPDHPVLHTVRTTVSQFGRTVDSVQSPLGLRWFKFDAETGFSLNGEHYHLEGADVHQDHAGWGNAVTNAGVYRDVKMVKDAGFNFIRGSHYPHHPAFYDACDHLGVLVWSEFCFWGTGGKRADGFWSANAYPPVVTDQLAFEASCLSGLTEMINEHRNNPSVIAWSMCNEVFFSDGDLMPQVKALLTKMVQLTHELDPGRPAGIGGCQRGDLDHLGDVAGYNGDGARLFPNPGIPNLVTEYGSVVEDRPGEYNARWTDHVENLYPWRSGRALWCMFDHGSIFGHFGFMGIVDYFRLPKRSWYWYRNFLKNIPPPVWPQSGTPARLQLTADKTTIAGDGTDDCQVIITVCDADNNHISNSVPVDLTILSGPGVFPTGRRIPFDPAASIAIRDGQAAIEFRSYYAGKTLLRASSPGLVDATLTITTLCDFPFEPRRSYPAPFRLTAPMTSHNAASAGANIALDHPTKASSEKAGSPASNANDGNVKSAWLASDELPGAWWQVDLENFESVARLKIAFPTSSNYRYRIDVSRDGQDWQTVDDESRTVSTEAVRTAELSPASLCRYLRITFTSLPPGVPAGLFELEAYGP